MTLPAEVKKLARTRTKKTQGRKSISNHALEHMNSMSVTMAKELVSVAMMDAEGDAKKLAVKEKALVDALKFVLPMARQNVHLTGKIEHAHSADGESLLDVHRRLREELKVIEHKPEVLFNGNGKIIDAVEVIDEG